MLYHIKQYIPKLGIADDNEAMFEEQSSQPENSGNAFIQRCLEVKRIFVFLTAICLIPTNKMCLNAF